MCCSNKAQKDRALVSAYHVSNPASSPPTSGAGSASASRKLFEHGLRHRRETGEDGASPLAVLRPAEFYAQRRKAAGDGDLLALRPRRSPRRRRASRSAGGRRRRAPARGLSRARPPRAETPSRRPRRPSPPRRGCQGRQLRVRSSGVPRGWRKRVGVEPTKDRLAAPPGFEVRTPHRGRFSSMFVLLLRLRICRRRETGPGDAG